MVSEQPQDEATPRPMKATIFLKSGQTLELYLDDLVIENQGSDGPITGLQWVEQEGRSQLKYIDPSMIAAIVVDWMQPSRPVAGGTPAIWGGRRRGQR